MQLSLEIAKKSILAAQTAISVTAHNIANATTEGYSRQRADIKTGVSMSYNGSTQILGTGVEIDRVVRIRDSFFDMQYRDNASIESYNENIFNAQSEIENVLQTTGDSDKGIKAVFNNFWGSMNELAKSPENEGIRESVRENALALASTFKQMNSSIAQVKGQYAQIVTTKVDEINQTSRDIQQINDEIGKLTALGQSPNDLLDKRDALLDKLSKNMDIQVVNLDNNKINVITGGHILVQDGKYSKLNASIVNDSSVSVKWDDGSTYKGKTGELNAAVKVVNEVTPFYQNKIDTLASDYITAFNTQHKAGFGKDGSTGVDFFTGTSARDFDVSADIKASVDKIAASGNGNIGDNSNIKKLSDLNSEEIIDGNKTSPLSYFDNTVTTLAIQTKEAERIKDNSSYILSEIQSKRSDNSGVSTDEEITNLIGYQQAFTASSKIIQTVDEMFQSLISAIN